MKSINTDFECFSHFKRRWSMKRGKLQIFTASFIAVNVIFTVTMLAMSAVGFYRYLEISL